MKILLVLTMLLSINAYARKSCSEPAGIYTDKEMVLDQFVYGNGNPNWGDWCYEGLTIEESRLCNFELDAWDQWVDCNGLAE